MKLPLPQVTLFCADTTSRFPWTLRAVERCVDRIDFGEVLIASDEAHLTGSKIPETVGVIEISPLRSIEDYSRFILERLCDLVRTSHVLIVQWDGFVLHPERWSEDFLRYDYIGAPWDESEAPYQVGNGGFSLRSRRLLHALPELPAHFAEPEDRYICQTLRQELEAQGMRFAPADVAAAFAIDHGRLESGPFGFHGPAHFPEVLDAQEAAEYVLSLDATKLFATRGGRDIALGLAVTVEHLATSHPSTHVLRPLISRLLQEGARGLDLERCGLVEADRVARAMIRTGYLIAAGSLVGRIGARFGVDAAIRLRARALARRWQRGLQRRPVD